MLSVNNGDCDNSWCKRWYAVGVGAVCGISTLGSLVTSNVLCDVVDKIFPSSCALGLAATGVSAALCSGVTEISDFGEGRVL